MKCVFILLVLMAGLSISFGAKMGALIQTETKYGKTYKFCDYKGVRMLPGASFKDLDTCMKCRCTKGGLGCASFGLVLKATGESECIHVQPGCKGRWVLKSNTSKRCPKRKLPKEMSGVGK